MTDQLKTIVIRDETWTLLRSEADFVRWDGSHGFWEKPATFPVWAVELSVPVGTENGSRAIFLTSDELDQLRGAL